MDSPVIVDIASKFGRGIDLDREFPGFNFDDEGFSRRGDFRSHLDDLASRHPEFADHLLGSSWGDVPFHGSLRNRRRGSGSGNNYQSHQDEDAKSQASGSSAASGASAVSSHGDPEIPRHESQEPRRNPIPQYGLRNTVDIGQHRMNMDNPQKVNRNQRSMSAPPENRQELLQQSEQPRFVSRVEITPQQQQQQEQLQREKSPEPQPQQTQQQKAQQQGNVRHIPIFVEGRDEPVIPRNVDDVPFPESSPPPAQFQTPPQYQHPPQYQAPPQFQPPPTFHRPSHFNDRFGRQNWPSQFQEAFFDQPRWTREEPERQFKRERTHQQQQQYPQPQQPQQPPQHPQYQQKQHPQYQQQAQNQPHQQNHPQTPQQQKQEPEVSKPKRPLPKDPLERVALVQKEVDSLTEQVKSYKGNSRKEKDYIYLDEMLTRELIKLDDIETEGKENVRLARKTAIKTIQDSINLLESKVPLPGQQQAQPQESQNQERLEIPETMETEQPEEAQNDKPIPLPPGPNSLVPSKEDLPTEQSQETVNAEAQVEGGTAEAGKIEAQVEACKVEAQAETGMADEVQVEAAKGDIEASQNHELVEAKSPSTMEVQQKSESKTENQTHDPSSQETQEVPKAAKSPKKVKKTKKQPAPVSEEPIPLPAPKSNQKGTK